MEQPTALAPPPLDEDQVEDRIRAVFGLSSDDDLPEVNEANLERYREVVTPLRRILLVGVSLVLGIFAGVSGSGKWRTFLMWQNREDFHTCFLK